MRAAASSQVLRRSAAAMPNGMPNQIATNMAASDKLDRGGQIVAQIVRHGPAGADRLAQVARAAAAPYT